MRVHPGAQAGKYKQQYPHRMLPPRWLEKWEDVETNDLLGGGIGSKFQAAIAALRKAYNFGKWQQLVEISTEYGGRTSNQLASFYILISMTRYLADKCVEIKLPRGRG